MSKQSKEKIAPAPQVEAPAPAPAAMPSAPMTQTQTKVSGFIRAAEMEAPGPTDITDIIEHDFKEAMAVPPGVARPEFDYCWLSIDDMEKDLYSQGGKWVLVTRSNHSHVPDSFFGMDGGLTYRGQNILGYCRKEVTQALEKRTADSFNRKTQQARNKMSKHGHGITVEETDMNKAGGVVGSEALATDAGYDFGETI